jgi:hypothetical protein
MRIGFFYVKNQIILLNYSGGTMKRTVFFLVLMLFLIDIYGQSDHDFTIWNDVLSSNSSPTSVRKISTDMPKNGISKTAKDTLRVLVIFIRYKDDSTTTTNWPSLSTLPSWAQTIVDTSIPSNHIFTPLNLSDFFDRSSGGDGNGTLGKFHMIGDVYYVTTRYNKSAYPQHGYAVYEALRQLDSAAGPYHVDFRRYDHWKFRNGNVDYNHTYYSGVADSLVDHVFAVFKDVSGATYGGYADLYLPTDFTSNEGVKVKSNAGSTSFNAQNSITPGAVTGFSHEYCHNLFKMDQTEGHWDGRSYTGWTNNEGRLNSFALMCAINNGWMCALERYKLGWLDPTVLTNTDSSFVLEDTYIKNKALLLPMRYQNSTGWPLEYFLVENYETRLEYSGANPFLVSERFGNEHVFNHGIMVYHVVADSFYNPTYSNTHIECANGRWSWKLLAGASTPSDYTDDLIGMDSTKRVSGFSERDCITIKVSSSVTHNDYVCLTPRTPITAGYQGWRYDKNCVLGADEHFFKEGFVEVFSKYSNPAAYQGDNVTAANFGFQITSFNPTTKQYVLNVQFGESGIQSLAPSKPQNLKVAYNPYKKPVLTWEANIEPNLSGYKVYRAKKSSGITSVYSYVTTLANSAIKWTDSETTVGDTANKVCYKITALNTGSKESVASDTVYVNYVDSLISSSTTFTGTVYIKNNLQVASGGKLRFEAGTNVYLANDVNINVLGTLNAVGTAASHVVFDREGTSGLWGSIISNGTTSGLLRYITLRNGWGVKYLNGCENEISYSLIENCTNGVYIENSNITVASDTIKPTNYGIFGSGENSYVVASDNVMTKPTGTAGYHNYQGIYLHNGTTVCAYHNDIRGFGFGMYYGGSSTTYLLDGYDYTPSVNNRLYDNYQGIGVTWSGICYAGDSYGYGGNNSIYGNELYQATLYQNGYLMANCNYWGGGAPASYNCDSSATFNYANYFTADPWLGQGLKTGRNQNVMTALAKTTATASEFKKARKLELAGQVDEEIAIYKEIASSEVFGKAALSNLARLQRKYNRTDIDSYFDNLVASNHQYKNHVESILASKALLDGNYSQAMSMYDKVIDADPTGYDGLNAKMGKFLAVLHVANDRAAAAKILDEVKSTAGDNEDLKLKIAAAETLLYGASSGTSEGNTVPTKNVVEETPKEFVLSANYPNPFNPTTTISYQLPKDGLVCIKIYDALGREVSTLVNESKTKGTYTVSFNAASLPSGLYLYSMKSGNFSSTKKMMLLK